MWIRISGMTNLKIGKRWVENVSMIWCVTNLPLSWYFSTKKHQIRSRRRHFGAYSQSANISVDKNTSFNPQIHNVALESSANCTGLQETSNNMRHCLVLWLTVEWTALGLGKVCHFLSRFVASFQGSGSRSLIVWQLCCTSSEVSPS